jgi:hypothetical protein
MSDGDADGSAKWRCAWCEKPQERNDPPCDNCGHHKFERAVVPTAPDVGDDYQREPVWLCPECGRQHQKNSPPCNRCGNATLDRHIPSDEDYADELGETSYLDLLDAKYAVALVVALVGAAVLVLGLLGVIALPGTGGGDLTVENVPGSADEANGVGLAAAERAYLAAVDDRRSDTDRTELERNDRLDRVATFANQRWVKSVYGDASRPSGERLAEAIGDTCRGTRPSLVTTNPQPGDEAFTSAGRLGTALADAAESGEVSPTTAEGSLTGVDVHVGPDGTVYLSQFVC